MLPSTMQAMVLEQQKQPLVLKTFPLPKPSDKQVLVKIIACGVCRTDLHIVDGELTQPKLPLTIGHEIVGIIVQNGNYVSRLKEGDIVGVPWLVILVANVNTVCGEKKIFAIMRCSQVIQLMEVMQNIPLLMRHSHE